VITIYTEIFTGKNMTGPMAGEYFFMMGAILQIIILNVQFQDEKTTDNLMFKCSGKSLVLCASTLFSL
jgi:hypothetical protein